MNPIYNLVFDIDGTLTEEASYISRNNIQYLEHTGHLITAFETHFIFPGVIELMHLLFKMPDVRVSFFSSGSHERNELFVTELLKLALGDDHFQKIKNDIRIYSGSKYKKIKFSDLTTIDLVKQKHQNEHFGNNFYGERKKCLRKIIGDDAQLENSILIDDEPSYVMYGQERNYFYFRKVEIRNFLFSSSSFSHTSFDDQGIAKIPIYTIEEENLSYAEGKTIIAGEMIGISFSDNVYTLHFKDLHERRLNELTISQDSENEIFEAMNWYYHPDKKKRTDTVSLTKIELDNYLYDLIQKANGKIKTIEFNCNRIYYLAGMLFKALKAARTGSTLTQYFFPIHFTAEDNQKYSRRFHSKHAEHLKEEHYHYGLKKLRKVNSNLSFVIPHSCLVSDRSYAASSSPASSSSS